MKPLYSMLWKAPLALCALAAMAWLSNHIGGLIFVGLNKVNPLEFPQYDWLTAWTQYRDVARFEKTLKISALLGVGLGVGGPIALCVAALADHRPLHGAARWATMAEIRKGGLLADKGILLGKIGNRYLCLGGRLFALLAAPTRSGKGVGVVIPNCLTFDGSLLVADVKLENWTKTAGFREQCGQKTFLWNPFASPSSVAGTHRQNPLAYISDDVHSRVSETSSIVAILYPQNDHDNGTSVFFSNSARNLATGLILYLVETPKLPRTLGELARQGAAGGQDLKTYLKAIIDARAASPNPLSAACLQYLNDFLSIPDETRGNVLATFKAPLALWANPMVDYATSACDWDWRRLRKEKMSIFLGITPNMIEAGGFLIRLFMSQAININTATLPEQDPGIKNECLLVMDEFPVFGRMPIVEKACGYMAGYGLRLLIIVQSYSQLKLAYREDGAEAISANAAARVIFPPKDLKDAKMVSETLGYLGQSAKSRGRSRGKSGGSTSENTSEQQRALMLPQELREMPQTDLIVLADYVRGIRGKKIRYFEESVFKERLLPPPKLATPDLSMFIAKQIEKRFSELPAGTAATVNLDALDLNLAAIPHRNDVVAMGQVTASEVQIDQLCNSILSNFDWVAAEGVNDSVESQNTIGPVMDLSVLERPMASPLKNTDLVATGTPDAAASVKHPFTFADDELSMAIEE